MVHKLFSIEVSLLPDFLLRRKLPSSIKERKAFACGRRMGSKCSSKITKIFSQQRSPCTHQWLCWWLPSSSSIWCSRQSRLLVRVEIYSGRSTRAWAIHLASISFTR